MLRCSFALSLAMGLSAQDDAQGKSFFYDPPDQLVAADVIGGEGLYDPGIELWSGEAWLVALCCSHVPAGRGRWTLRMLADKLVELEIVDTISYETVRTALKKTNCNLGGV